MRLDRLLACAFCLTAVTGCNDPGTSSVDVAETDNSLQATYSVSGTISAFDSTVMDSDVNDSSAPYVANDPDINAAQVINNPVTLGGYVNLAGQGAAGRSKAKGDPRDFFRVQLIGNQVISVYQGGDPDKNDLDLYVYDSNGNLVDASADIGTLEQLTIKDAGIYYVMVEAWPGVPTTATNYVLTVGLGAATTAVGGLTLSSEFMPGEVLADVKSNLFIDSADSSSAMTLAATATRFGLQALAGAPGRIMRFGVPSASDRVSMQMVHSAASGYRSMSSENEKKLQTLFEVKSLLRRADVVGAAPNYRREIFAVPTDPLYRVQWHYPMINLPATWDVTTGNGAIVAVLDTGVVLRHPDLQGQLVSGYDFISYASVSVDGDGIDANPDDPGDQSGGPTSSSFHGTHVAGTVAAATNNGIGVAGVAWNAKVMPIRVLGKGGGYDYDIIQGAYFAAGLANDSRTLPAKKADIINMSLGGSGSSSLTAAAYKKVRDAGVIVIAAAGNSGNSSLSYPASYDGVVSVAAVDIRKSRASYSQYNAMVDVTAPGGYVVRYAGGGFADVNGDGYDDGVMSTLAVGGSGSVTSNYANYMGTSMACPHMAGVVALMRAANPAMTPQNLDEMLAASAITEDLGSAGRDNEHGWGLVDSLKAVQAAIKLRGGTTYELDPVLSFAPAALNFGTSSTDLTFSVRNGGGGVVTVVGVNNDSGSWLTVSPAVVDVNGLGTYNAKINRDKLPVGTYSAKIAIVSSANSIEIPVIMGVNTRPNAGDAGNHYVLLVDANTGAVVADATLKASNGYYVYSLDGIVAGTYIVVGGTDLNNDGFICDAGEACGGFPLLYGAQRLTVDSSKAGIDFATGFSPQIWASSASFEPGDSMGGVVTNKFQRLQPNIKHLGRH